MTAFDLMVAASGDRWRRRRTGRRPARSCGGGDLAVFTGTLFSQHMRSNGRKASSILLTIYRGYDRNQNRTSSRDKRAFDRIPLAFALCGSSDLRSWTGTCYGQRVVSPSRSEGKRTRRWQTAGVSDQKKSVGRLSADSAEASTWSWNRSFCARRRSTAGLTWSMRYRNGLPRRSAARRARFPRCDLSPSTLSRNLTTACVSQRS